MLMLHEKGFFALKIKSPDQVCNCALPEIRHCKRSWFQIVVLSSSVAVTPVFHSSGSKSTD